MRGLCVLALLVAVAPAPLRGEPAERTGLRLLVADSPPFVLDVDRGTVTRVRGGLVLLSSPISVVDVGGRAGVIVAGDRLFGVDGHVAGAWRPRGTRVVPAADGASVWVQTTVARGRCTLRRLSLAGRTLRAPRAFPCGTDSDPRGGELGIVVKRTRVVDPETGRTTFGSGEGIVAVLGRRVLTVDSSARLTLVDAETAERRAIPNASTLGGVPRGIADWKGRYAVLEWGDPAWGGGSSQVLDLWLLDGETGELAPLPAMPAEAALKFTSVTWTRDGRLVLLGESGNRSIVALWRPGERAWRVKTVRLPRRAGGSDSFAALR